jgi:hypothetical protein
MMWMTAAKIPNASELIREVKIGRDGERGGGGGGERELGRGM